MNNVFKFLLVIVLFASLNGCSVQTKKSDDITATFSRQIKPAESTSPAVLALIKKARVNAMNGELDKAMLRLERAVRIEPANAVIWHYMAKLFLQQENYKQAAGYASRSNSMARADKSLVIDNWRIIAHARFRLGNRKGALKAQDRINKLQQ